MLARLAAVSRLIGFIVRTDQTLMVSAPNARQVGFADVRLTQIGKREHPAGGTRRRERHGISCHVLAPHLV